MNAVDCMKVKKKNVQFTQPKWFDKECNNIKKLKYKALRRFRKTNDDNDLTNYIQTKRDFRNICDQKKKTYKDNVCAELVDSLKNSKNFWGIIRNLTRNRTKKPI